MAMNPYEMRWEFLQKAQERLEYQLSHNVSRWSEMKEAGENPGPYPEYPTACLLYTSPSPRDLSTSRMPSSA